MELFITIGMMMVLIALLLPALNIARQNARFTRWRMHADALRADPAMVAYYDFQQGTGTTLTNSAVLSEGRYAYIPEKYDGRTWSTFWGVGRFPPQKRGLYFMGWPSYVDCGKAVAFEITEAITVISWVLHVSGSGHIVNRGGGWNQSGFSLFWLNNNIRVELQDTGRGEKVMSDFPAPASGRWHQIAFTWDRATRRIQTYINGAPVANAPNVFNGPIGVPVQNVNIGRNEVQANHFTGFIDEVLVFNRALSAGEIRNHYRMGRP